ncbi:MAG: ATP-binding protein [Christensenellaceae bacterium]|nr:ATP-binding protein [Christensenellaceae bacterium]
MDDGTVAGVPEKAAPDIIKNFIAMVNNLDVISPTVYLSSETLEYEGKKIVHIHVPPSSEVHSFKKVIFDRVDDADVKVTATGQIAQMYIRKQRIFTEKKVYPYVKDEHLCLDMFARIRQLAVNRFKDHPWKTMSDMELFKSARHTAEKRPPPTLPGPTHPASSGEKACKARISRVPAAKGLRANQANLRAKSRAESTCRFPVAYRISLAFWLFHSISDSGTLCLPCAQKIAAVLPLSSRARKGCFAKARSSDLTAAPKRNILRSCQREAAFGSCACSSGG